MNKELIQEQANQFCKAWQSLDSIYQDYCRTVDVPYTTLYVMNLIMQMENCTQKDICERGLLPKQTVNTIVTGFYKQGFVKLTELPEDRRIKTISLTEEGKEYAGKIIPQIRQAEFDTMSEIPEEQRKVLLDGIQLYCKIFRGKMLK